MKLGRTSSARSGRLALLVYRLALRVYPRVFRERFAAGMTADFRALLGESSGLSRVSIALAEIADLLTTRVRNGRDCYLPAGVHIPGASDMTLKDRLYDLIDDVRLAARNLRRRPGYSLIVVLTLALGVGAAAAVFTVIDAVLWQQLPYADPDRLVALYRSDPERGNRGRFPLTATAFDAWARQASTVTDLQAYVSEAVVIDSGQWPERVRGARVTPGMFGLLGAAPARGVTLGPDADSDTVVLSDAFWRRALGADPEAVGGTVRLDGRPHRIVGVMPPEFRLPFYANTDLWRPLVLEPGVPGAAEPAWLTVLARLAPGSGIAAALDELNAIALAVAERIGEERWTHANVVPLRSVSTDGVAPVLRLLALAVAMLLLIACVNLAGLTLARGIARSREMAVRAAIGAGTRRLARLVMVEALLLALASGAAGVLIAGGAVDALLSIAPEWPPSLRAAAFGASGAGFAMALAGALTLAFGIVPAIRLARPRLAAALQDGDRSAGDTPARLWTRRALVAGQLALAVVLLMGAALMVRSMLNILSMDLGLNPDGIVTARIGSSTTDGGVPAASAGFATQLEEAVVARADVAAIAVASSAPMGPGADWVRLEIDGVDPGQRGALGAEYRQVSAGYFDLLGLRLRAGRLLSPRDSAGAPAVTVVTQDFVDRFLGGQDPIGKLVDTRPASGGGERRSWEIVGVVDNVREYGATGFLVPLMYVPFDQHPIPSFSLLVRSDTGVAALHEALRPIAASIDASRPLERVVSLSEDMASGNLLHAFVLALLGAFSALAVVLAAVGLYGTLAQHVGARTREIAVRCALGADTRRIRSMVLRGSAALSGVGLVLGLGAAALVARQMAGMLFSTLLVDVPWWDPVSFVVVPVVLLAVAAVASFVPARRASRVDPAEALRADA